MKNEQAFSQQNKMPCQRGFKFLKITIKTRSAIDILTISADANCAKETANGAK
jgi:response regulator of citrate/malate metabolism